MRPTPQIWPAAFSLLLCFHALAVDSPSPLHTEFSDVANISKHELQKNLAQYQLIDVRSRFEFDTIHITGAQWAPISERQFYINLKKITKGDLSTKLAFYCNGHDCNKSYLASRMARQMGYKHSLTYDEGILAWAREYPQHTTLMNQTPADAKKIISEQQYQKHTLGARQFKQQCIGPGRVVFDVRDPIQRRNLPYLDGITQKYPLDMLTDLLDTEEFRKKHGNKTFCFLDSVGRQVRWLQYYLESNKYNDYIFLEGGARNN